METMEELMRHSDELKILDEKDMDEVVQMLSHATWNMQAPVNVKSPFFDTVAILKSYTIQMSRKVGHSRIVKDGVRMAHGPQDLFSFMIYQKALEKKKLLEFQDKNVGIVFAGGGAKGAYQIGVWRALEELGIARKIKGVAGTSVGALNALLFAQGDLKIAENTWNNVEQLDLAIPDLEVFIRPWIEGQKYLGTNPISFFTDNETFTEIIDSYRKTYNAALITNTVPKMINNSIRDYSFLEDKLIYVCTTQRGWIAGRDKDHNVTRPRMLQAYYPLLNILDEDDIKKVVVASTCIPGVYKKKVYKHMSLFDGGWVDNYPYGALDRAGFKKILVIHLGEEHDLVMKHTHSKNVRLYDLYPSRDLGGTIKINKNLTRQREEIGYEDALKRFKPLVDEILS